MTNSATDVTTGHEPRLDGQGLVIEGLTVRYGDAIADNAVSITVDPGEIVALLGANGAGKSSLLNAVSGIVPTASGEVSAGGVSLEHLSPQERAHLVAQVPEGRRLFPNHTVQENLLLAAFGASAQERQSRLEEVLEVLPQLRGLINRRADLLSGGEQQMVALGRGLMGKAPILMIDELSLGLAPTIAQRFAETLLTLKEQGYAILLVEQYIPLAMQVADRVVLLHHGNVVLQGTADEVRDEVLTLEEAYLGGQDPALEEAAFEELVPEGPAFNLPDRRLVLGAGAYGLVILAVTLFLPWFEVTGNTTTTTLRGYNVPAQWIWLPFGLAVLALLAHLMAFAPRRSGLAIRFNPMIFGVIAATCGVACLGLLVARCWLLSGLPGPPGASIQRAWGLLLAFTGAGPAVAGAGVVLLVSQFLNRSASGSTGEPPLDEPLGGLTNASFGRG